MTPAAFNSVLHELIDENPLAVRAMLRVLTVEFTDKVPTLAVTCEQRPRLLVNLDFIGRHCRSDDEVKAVICHEFLHVLLRHTEKLEKLSAAEHLALDAVINSIIHRTLGPTYSGFMSRYYAWERGLGRLLRPPEPGDLVDSVLNDWIQGLPWRGRQAIRNAWGALYEGKLVADDIRDLARDLSPQLGHKDVRLLGGHEQLDTVSEDIDAGELPEALTRAIEHALKTMNGHGLFRNPKDRSVGAAAYEGTFLAEFTSRALTHWWRQAYAVLRRHLAPDANARGREARASAALLPVLSTGDRRAAMRALWSPFLPEAAWPVERRVPSGTAQVYLDVSGSMNAEMPELVALLERLGGWIRRPFWAFSDVVAPARIAHGGLVAETTGGTSLSCVLEHLARTRPTAAVIITDGFIEALDPALLKSAAGTRLHAIVSHDGNPGELVRGGIPYTQLARLPS